MIETPVAKLLGYFLPVSRFHKPRTPDLGWASRCGRLGLE